ncbi:MAG: flagellar hook assembly protein FlgD [Methylococcales bacterium]|nr:flagellar hook assembly protein FlgD [Methylococcales bacterium]
MAINTIEALQNLGLTGSSNKVEANKQELGQEEFLRLMTAQLTHQDPNEPMDNGDFLAQMAQFSTVEGIADLNSSFSEFANSLSSGQSLQAASLVGHSVSVPSNEGVMSLTKNMTGEIYLDDRTSDLKLSFSDSNGQIVKTISLGSQQQGYVPFEWDGLLDDGTYTDPGVYNIKAEAIIDGNNTLLQSFVNADVDSVALGGGNNGIQLTLVGLGDVNFNEIRKIF